MPELRWNPVLKRWNIISDKRQDRPVLPEDSCPLCPGVLEVPQDDYYIVTFENRFPSLERKPDDPNPEDDSFYKVRENRGVCEVILYSSDHEVPPADLSLGRMEDLVPSGLIGSGISRKKISSITSTSLRTGAGRSELLWTIHTASSTLFPSFHHSPEDPLRAPGTTLRRRITASFAG